MDRILAVQSKLAREEAELLAVQAEIFFSDEQGRARDRADRRGY
jgi:hypothetical protein